jgi:hypothetical protein
MKHVPVLFVVAIGLFALSPWILAAVFWSLK